MSPWMPFRTVILAVLVASRIETFAQTSTEIAFNLDTEVLSLAAALIEVRPNPSYTAQSVYTFSVNCPTAASPDNDACRSLSIYPAQIWHTQGSMWGGTTTARLDDSTTVWECNLGSGVSYFSGTPFTTAGPSCVKNITASGGSTTAVTTYLDDCDVATQSIPLFVTEGMDKLPSAYYLTWAFTAYETAYASRVLSDCGPSRTRPAVIPATTTGSASSASGAATLTTTQEGGTIKATKDSVSSTITSASSSTASPTGDALHSCKRISWLGVVLVVMVSLIV